MVRTIAVLAVAWPVLLMGQESVPEPPVPSQQTAGYLLKACTASSLTPSGRLRRQYCAGYLAGVEETLRVVAPSQAGFCLPGAVTTRQLVSAYIRHVSANPQSAGQPAAVIASEALRQAFPCKSGGQ